MQKAISILLITLSLLACNERIEKKHLKQADWATRKADTLRLDSLHQGRTYLPVYSHVYHINAEGTFDLTSTISIRNVSITDTIYILKADYYNTIGENIRQYIEKAIFVAPMETVEIVMDEEDLEGGSGANFIFNWAVANAKNPPLFEAVMISTYGQQGVSFATRGIPIFD